jgi:diguanylate cyclase (GGDEF)-like protein
MLSNDRVSDSSDSLFAYQLNKGYSALRFDAPLESRFVSQYIANHQSKLRWSVCVAILLFILFAVLDAYLLPGEVAVWGTGIRGVVVLALLFNLLATFLPSLKAQVQVITSVVCSVAGIGVILIIYIAQYYGADIPFTGMMLIVFVFYFLSGLLFRKSLITGLVALLVYVLLGLIFDSPAVDIIYNSSFLFAANLIGCVGCYSYEYAARTNFLVHSMLNEMAERDGLTGLFNRRAFDQHLDHIWRQATRKQTPLAIAMIDVDHFKQYNDQFGHQEGDQSLKQIATILKEYSQRSTDFVARYGGEEFIGVWSDISLKDAQNLLEKIRCDIERTLALPQADDASHEVVTVSIGLAYSKPQIAQEPEDQIKQSDQALYRAKEKGRNQIVVVEY